MIYNIRTAQLIQSEIIKGHVYETYIVFSFDDCINSGVSYMTLEYLDGELVYIKTR